MVPVGAGSSPARLDGRPHHSDYADVTDLNRTESNWLEINGVEEATNSPLSLRPGPGVDRPCLRTSWAPNPAPLQQERTGGGTEGRGTPRTGGDGGRGHPRTGGDGGDGEGGHPRTEGIGGSSRDGSGSGARPGGTRSQADHVCADEHLWSGREPHTLNHLEGPPQADSRVSGAGPGICIFKQLLQVDSKFKDSLRRWGGALECQSFPGRWGPPQGLLPAQGGTLGVRSADTLPAPNGSGTVATLGALRSDQARLSSLYTHPGFQGQKWDASHNQEMPSTLRSGGGRLSHTAHGSQLSGWRPEVRRRPAGSS